MKERTALRVFPTSIDFNAAGDANVTTNGVGAPGSGQVINSPR